MLDNFFFCGRSRAARGLLALSAALSLAACGGGNASISGTLSGLLTGNTLVLTNNSTDTLTLSANGSFSFPTLVTASSTYNVSVSTQPSGQTCTVANGSGTVDSFGTSVTGITVVCSTSTSSAVNVTVSGLNAGLGFTMYLNGNSGNNPLSVAANGSYAFSGLLAVGATYTVTVATEPSGQTCTASNGSGVIVAGVTPTVSVLCI
jgi:hypothetical protein